MTLPNAQLKGNKYGVSINSDSKLEISSTVNKETKSALSIFKNTDFSKSKGRAINLVSVSEEDLKSSDEYEMAEAIFHELKAHIDFNTGDEDQDHIKYGKTGIGLYMQKVLTDPLGNFIPDEKGNNLTETVPKNSPAGKMVKELTDMKSKDAKNAKK
jgi:hypothetical protein